MADLETRRQLFTTEYEAPPTDETLNVMAVAGTEAQRFNHNYIGTEHLLLALVREPQTQVIFDDFKVEVGNVRNAVEFIIGRGDRPIIDPDLGLTSRAKRVMSLSVDEARRLNDHQIMPDHILLGLVREGEGIAAGVMESLGVSLERVRISVLEVRADRKRMQELESGIQPDVETPIIPKSLEGLMAFLNNPESDPETKLQIETILANLTKMVTPKTQIE